MGIVRPSSGRPRTSGESVPSPGPHTVYYLHFPDGSHYLGATSVGPQARLKRHLQGKGSKYVYKRARRVGAPRIALQRAYPSRKLAFIAERKLKRNTWPLKRACPYCHPELTN